MFSSSKDETPVKSKIQNDTKCHPGARPLSLLSSWKERAKRATDRGCHPGTKRTIVSEVIGSHTLFWREGSYRSAALRSRMTLRVRFYRSTHFRSFYFRITNKISLRVKRAGSYTILSIA